MSLMMSVQTSEDGTDTSLPSFSTFTSELDPTWDYYDRDRSNSDVITSQSNNYTRPWEMETKERGFEPVSKLPSFQSQFHSYGDTNMMPEPSLPQVTPIPVPMSPNSAATASPGNGSLTQLTPINPLQTGLTPLSSPSFHTLTAVNSRPYPIVPAPIQARDIPIQTQYLDERHMQLYQPHSITTYAVPPSQNITILKNEPSPYDTMKNGLHHPTSFSNPMENGFHHHHQNGKIDKSESPMRNNNSNMNDSRKTKDRRKMRASSLESSAESENSAMETGDGNSGQVAAISSTASFKSPAGSMGMTDDDTNGEKQTKKKRKRCGECIGCQKKDNCGDCAPCRNDKSHQICKQRRCEKLTDKKIYGADGSLLRPESRRGRGKGRGGASARGRKVNSGAAISPRATQSSISPIVNSPAPAAVPHPSPNTASSTATVLVTATTTPSVNTSQFHSQQPHQEQTPHQPTQQAHHPQSQIPQQSAQQQQNQAAQQQQQQPPPNQAQQHPNQMKEQTQQPMTPMAFYPTWQDPSQGWQSQYIQQIPQNTSGISAINSLEFQPQGYAPYQPTGYVHGFDPNYGRSYGAPVQRYDFQSNQIPPINQVSLQSVSFAPSASYAGQVSTGPSPMLLGGQNDLNKTMSGNDMPGYPRVSSVPQHSLNCNGYSGEFNSGNQNSTSSLDSNHKGSQSQQSQQQQQQQQQNTSVPQSHINQTSQQNCNPMEGGLMNDPNALIKSNGLRQPMDSMNQWKSPTNGLRPPIESNSHWKSPLDDVHHQQQQNSQTGHFLSYSHHLRDLNTDGLNNNNSSDNLFPVQPNLNVEPNGGGGAGSHWKSNLNALHVPPESKPPDDFQCSQPQTQQQATPTSKNPEKPAKKPTPKRQRKKPNASTQSTKQSTDDKKNSSDFMPNFNNKGNDMYGSIGSAYGSSNSKFGPIPNENSNTSTSATSYFHGADPLNPYSEFNVKIKQEPLTSLPPRQPYPIPPASASGTNYPIKMEGYEQNYQNFINYADYCQSQSQSSSTTTTTMSNQASTIAAQQQQQHQHQQQQQQQHQHQHQSTEYGGQTYGNYPPYSNAAYHHAHHHHHHPHHQSYSNSSYTNSSGVPNFSSIPSADTNCNPNTNQTMSTGETADIKPFIRDSNPDNKDLDSKSTAELTKLTNYEKDIPIHTYPNHGRFTDNNNHTNGSSNSSGSSHQAADGMKTHKIDDGHSSTTHKDHLNNDKLKSDDMDLEKAYSSAERVAQMSIDRTEKGMKPEVPDCDCFPSDEKSPPEPGSYYTHLGCASTLIELRADMENRIGIRGRQLRIEKVIYSGKEGKTAQGCPLAKWVIRRSDKEEKILCIVKRRQGHKCKAAFIVVCIVAWDGMPKQEADNSYRLLIHKLNKFGLPTTRRCATNENRTCACQGLDPETSGASFSFGCSWSMYYNGCKYARSKTVRKFRLSVKSEESEIEDHMNVLATMLSPLYKMMAPKAYENQCKYESEAPDCRLGLKPGKPFSGVTTCMDFCAHAHRDLHNMQDGCTVQVGLLKPKTPGGYSNDDDDEQLHILPLYIMDTSDEFDNVEAQKDKNKTGAVQVLEKFPCEVRVRATPLLPCRRHGKKRNGKDIEDEPGTPTEETAPPTPSATPAPPTPNPNKKECGSKKSAKNQTKQQQQSSPSHPLSRAETPNIAANPLSVSNNSTTSGSPSNLSAFSAPNQNSMMNSNSNLINMASMIDNFTDAQLQSNQISSTVLDSPYSYDYATGSYIDKRNYYNQQWIPPHAMEYGYPPADRHEQVKSRSSEENPDSTTLINANNNNSAFSPSVDAAKKQQLLLQQQPEYPTYGYHHSAQSAYPMYPTYSTPAYNQVQQDYPPSALRYNFYSPHHPHHQTYNPYDIYHHAQPGQTQTSPPNWNLFSPAAPSAVPVLTPSASVPTPAASQTNHSVEPLPTLTTLSPSTVPTPDVNIEQQQQQQQQQQQPQQQQQQQQQQPPQHNQPPCNTNNINNEQRTPPNPQKSEPIGEITEINDNLDCFQDVQMGGVGIALEHGSVLIECAKHEMHATTSLKKPNRKNPTRITLIFYQHRNLNRHRHGIEEWEEKMRLKRLGITIPIIDEPKNEAPATKNTNKTTNNATKPKSKPRKSRARSDKPKKEKTISSVESIKETISSVV